MTALEPVDRSLVAVMGRNMTAKLETRRERYEPCSWRWASLRDLIGWLDAEVAELKGALANGAVPDEVWSEAADVANLAAMIADSYQARAPVRSGGRGR